VSLPNVKELAEEQLRTSLPQAILVLVQAILVPFQKMRMWTIRWVAAQARGPDRAVCVSWVTVDDEACRETSSFQGASKTSEPGIHFSTFDAAQWIPGLRLAAHPGMTQALF
jgi:hypothetical protein